MFRKTFLEVLALALLTSFLCNTASAQDAATNEEEKYNVNAYFEKAIVRFETEDKENPPPEGAIVCIGSSSILAWHGTIKQDLAPLTVIPRGFGGSVMADALHYVDRIVIPYKPRAVVLYEGDNDVHRGVPTDKIEQRFLKFVGKIHTVLPETRIYVISVKPSVRRWNVWEKMVEANTRLADLCVKDERLTFIDIATPMMDETGRMVRKDIFKEDMLHMNRDGYIIWRDTIRPVLLEAELKYEPNAEASESENKDAPEK